MHKDLVQRTERLIVFLGSVGILKIQFPCLSMLRVETPEYAAEIIKTCVVLHNLCINLEGAAEDEVVMQYIQEQVEQQSQQLQVDESDAIVENQNQ